MNETTSQPLEGYTVQVDWAGPEDISTALLIRPDGTVVMTHQFWAASESVARAEAQNALQAFWSDSVTAKAGLSRG